MEIERQFADRGKTAVLRVVGSLDAWNAGSVYEQLAAVARSPTVGRVVVDLRRVDTIDTAGVVVCTLGRRMIEAAHKSFALDNLSGDHRAAFAQVPTAGAASAAPSAPSPSLAERIGARSLVAWNALRDLAALIGETLASAARWLTGRERVPRGAIVEQCVKIGRSESTRCRSPRC
jgi:anti-anti-sigma regulatory factor